MPIWPPSGPSWKNIHGENNIILSCDRSDACPLGQAVQEKASKLRLFEQHLQQKQQKLYKQEKTLNRRSNELKQREDRLAQAESASAGRSAVPGERNPWKEDLSRYEASLRERQEARQSELNRRESLLDARDAQLTKRDEALSAREKELNAREESLKRRHEAIIEASVRYEQERKYWEAMKLSAPDQSGPTMEAELHEVKGAFMGINSELKNTQLKLRELIVAVEHSGRDGVAKLCDLYRDMTFSQDEQVRRLADRLGVILRFQFEAEPVEPSPGEAYDSSCHERMDISCPGERVMCCMARGWRWKDEIILRAVVDTNERDVNT